MLFTLRTYDLLNRMLDLRKISGMLSVEEGEVLGYISALFSFLIKGGFVDSSLSIIFTK